MKITNEIKEKVFAQYFGQKIFKVSKTATATQINDCFFIGSHIKDAVLILTPLSEITDEDAIEVAKNGGWDTELTYKSTEGAIMQGKHWALLLMEKKITINAKLYHYLQSKGYDLPNYFLEGKTLIESGLAVNSKNI